MKIAILGTRGIPAKYGGFETCAEELSVRLAERGHEVTVYCETEDQLRAASEYKGVHLVQLPKLKKQYADYAFNGISSTFRSLLSDADVLHFFGCDYVPFAFFGRLSGKGVVLTLDGLEWKRMGYPFPYRIYLRSFAEMAMLFPHFTVVDSRSAQEWYYERTRKKPLYVPYGTNVSTDIDQNTLKKYDLAEGGYILFVGRLVYEKGAHILIEAFKSTKTDLKLVIVGDSLSASEYSSKLKDTGDDRIKFLGFVHGREFSTLRNASLIYVHPSLFDGTSIALLGAIGAGRCVLSSNLRENVDVGGDAVAYFENGDVESLRKQLQILASDPSEVERLQRQSCERANRLLSWDSITAQYEDIYRRSLHKKIDQDHSTIS